MECVFSITGSRDDLRELAKTVNTPEACITEENEQFFIRSNRFDPLADNKDVMQVAKDLTRLLDGAACLQLRRRQSLKLDGGGYRVHDDGKKAHFFMASAGVFAVAAAFPTMTVRRVDGTEEVINAADGVPVWLTLAYKNAEVAKVLRYFSGDLNWGTLYKIHEAIERDMGGEAKIESAGWATKKEQKRFTHTANNYQALKEDARHSGEDCKPPANPMSLSEAKAFINALAQAWLNYKVGPSLPVPASTPQS